MLICHVKKTLLGLVCLCLFNSSVFSEIHQNDKLQSPRQKLDVNLNNVFAPEKNRYSFLHMQEFLPTITIWTGNKPISEFKYASPQLNNIPFRFIKPSTKQPVETNLEKMLVDTNTDGFVVLKNGKIVVERYLNGQDASTRHQMMSVSKSIFGSLTAMLIAEGKLKRNAKVVEYIPELKDSAFGDATVDQVMNMTIGIKYSEDYLSPHSEITQYIKNMGLMPENDVYNSKLGIRNFLPTLKKEKVHGTTFHYVTPISDVMCWLAERASGMTPTVLLEKSIWQKMGMERDAYVLVDPQGVPSCGGGVNATTRDMARFGQMILQKGQFNGQQILPTEVVERIAQGGDAKAYANSVYARDAVTPKGSSYVDQFWFFNNPEKSFSAWGINGQWIYVDPKHNVVIVKQSSLDLPEDHDIEAYTLAAFSAIAASLDK